VHASPGQPHLLVVPWRGTPPVEALGGAAGPQDRDVPLAADPDDPAADAGFHTRRAGQSVAGA
jgi:hypothetical protein